MEWLDHSTKSLRRLVAHAHEISDIVAETRVAENCSTLGGENTLRDDRPVDALENLHVAPFRGHKTGLSAEPCASWDPH